MLRVEEHIKEVGWRELNVQRHVKAISRLETLSKAQDAIDLLRDTELLGHEEEVEWLNAPLEGLEADLVFRLLTLNMHKVTILLLLRCHTGELEVAGSIGIVAISKTIFAITALDEHPVTACVVDQIHLHVTLANEDGALIEIVEAVSQVQLDVVVAIGLT